MNDTTEAVDAALAFVETFSSRSAEWAMLAAEMMQFERAGEQSHAETAARILAAEVRRLRAERPDMKAFREAMIAATDAAFDCGDHRGDPDEYDDLMFKSQMAKERLISIVFRDGSVAPLETKELP